MEAADHVIGLADGCGDAVGLRSSASVQPDPLSALPKQRDGVWLEGTAQAALVLSLTGHPDKAEPLFTTIAAQMAPSGLVYATENEQLTTGLQVGPNSAPGDFKYYRLPHIGATGWAVLAALKINPFVGRKGQSSTSEDRPCPPK